MYQAKVPIVPAARVQAAHLVAVQTVLAAPVRTAHHVPALTATWMEAVEVAD